MKPFESQSPNPMPETEFVSCQSIAPLLMELFDGETDENSATRARAHLLACQHCAQAWLEWNQTQSILRSHPVPAPPPTLLWRIVLAARFATFKRTLPFGIGARKNLPSLERLYGFFEPHEAPASLKSQILASTTRQKNAANPVVPAFSFFAKKKFGWPAFPMLAAPALAAFLLLVSHDTLKNDSLTSPRTTEVEESPVGEAPLAKIEEKPDGRAKSSIATAGSGKIAMPPRVAVRSVPSGVTEEKAVEVDAEPAEPRRATLRPGVQAAPREREEVRSRVQPHEGSHPVVQEAIEVEPQPKSMVLLTSSRGAASAPTSTSRYQSGIAASPKVKLAAKAALSHDLDTPVPQLAQFRSAKPRLARLLDAQGAPLPTRVSRPVASAPKAMLVAYDDFDGDEHINELQSVVADFRATLSDEDSSEDGFAADEG